MKKSMGRTLAIIAGCLGILTVCILPSAAAVCDGPPNSQSFILFTGGCDRSPQVLPCTQGFIFPALPSPGGDFPTQYYLDFGDGSPPYYGTVDGITHTYTSPGEYTLNYMAGTQCDLWRQGTHVLNIPAPQNYTPVITTCTPAHPVAGFSGTPVSGFAPLTVRFTSTSAGADAWAWKFGDGGSSPAENPSHTYGRPGTYSVSLTARDSCTGTVSSVEKLGFVIVTTTAGTLTISSTPPGAIVFIDNVVKGITPVTLTDTAAGSHTLLLTLSGYEDYTRSFTTDPSSPATIGASLTRSPPQPTTQPTPSYGSVAVTSIPTGATVILDGRQRGTAPTVIHDLVPGNHDLVLSLLGYTAWSQVVSVGSGQTTAVNANLVATGENPPGTGSLAVTSDPPGAEVYIDDGFKGVSPVTIAGLSAGNHSVSLRLQGYEDTTTNITIAAGQIGRFPAVLQKTRTLSQMDIALAAVAVMMIVIIGVVVMLRKDTKK